MQARDGGRLVFGVPTSHSPLPMQLLDLCYGRSGDKGDAVNVGLIARDPAHFDWLRETVTAERVKAHFGPRVDGDVERFELPNLSALNFLLHGALGGGGTLSLKTDAQGKVYSTALLRMVLDIPDEEARRLALTPAP